MSEKKVIIYTMNVLENIKKFFIDISKKILLFYGNLLKKLLRKQIKLVRTGCDRVQPTERGERNPLHVNLSIRHVTTGVDGEIFYCIRYSALFTLFYLHLHITFSPLTKLCISVSKVLVVL